MQIQATYPVVVTNKLSDCRDFYGKHFGFQVVFEASWFVYLASESGDCGIAFMAPDHPSSPPGPEPFTGNGVFLTFQVADAAAEFERFSAEGAAIAYPLKSEVWGQRRFGLIDPAGMWLDVVEQIDPQAGFWDKYIS